MGMVERLKSWCNSHHHRQTPTLFWKQITQFGVKCFRVWCHHLITLQFRVRRKACANSALVPIAPHESAKTAKGWMRKQRGWSETVGICRCECPQCRVFSRHGCSEERFLPTKEWVSQQVQWMTRNVHLLEEVVKEVFTDKKDRREEDEEEKRSSPLSLCFWFRGYVGCHICS